MAHSSPLVLLAALLFALATFAMPLDPQQPIIPAHSTPKPRIFPLAGGTFAITGPPIMAQLPPRPHHVAEEKKVSVQTWYGAQKEHGCDRTACASCRFAYRCQKGRADCLRCDEADYCSACEMPERGAGEL
ncbi:hypothetical protein B0A48_12070 [Cryoendolithus antarcticus]|uniref:ZZ-type domain-containing protein n=1 Tax=Cryoendolithus antarcticus TaxID=1507870 RepID=A0A1V8STP3_9PEZI|nr:hypothetical protein B0A48_12070 [Cryoendolithus antarcticus]